MFMSKNPLVSVIVVNFNGRSLLEQCLCSLMKNTYPNFEVILVDNNSTDDSIEFVKNTYPNVIIIKLEKNYGFAYPSNVGAKNAKGDFLLFLNNDTKHDPDFITELIKEINRDPQIAMCQSLLLKPNGSIGSSGDFIDSLGIAFSSKEKTDSIRNILAAKGASIFIKREIFDKLNGFDEKFFASFEDIDLGWRTWMLGYNVVLAPKSVVYHLGGQTIKSMDNTLTFHGYKNQLAMKITNFEFKYMLKSFLLFFVFYGPKEIKIWFDYKLKGSTKLKATLYEEKIALRPNFKLFLKSLFWILKNNSYISKKQKLVKQNRVRTTKDLIELGLIRT